MVSKYDAYELNSIMYDIRELGFVTVSKYKIWRLLGKGSGAAGTWKAFLDEWIELDGNNKRNDLHILEYGDRYLISHHKTNPMRAWAGEV